MARKTSALLHPRAIVTGAVGGRLLGGARRFVVKRLYTHLARRYAMPDWTTMNYGYAPLPGEDFARPGGDEAEAFGLNLYWRVATAGPHGEKWRGLDVVEIGSGRGGGAAYLAQSLKPESLTAIDIAPTATVLATARHAGIAGLRFATGDAEAIDRGGASADIVINIESAHGYASVPRFLAEVARVLRPGGALLFAGFVARGKAEDRLVEALRTGPLRLDRLDDITANITASLAADEARKRAFLDASVTGWFKSFAVGAYALSGTPMRRALEAGETRYLAAVLSKA